jgi:ATP-binding protein involved in chromosome partitioning
MSQLNADVLREALRAVVEPGGSRDIVSAGLVEGVQVKGGLVHVILRAERSQVPAMEAVSRQVQAVLSRQPGVQTVTTVLTSHRAEPAAPPRPAPHGHGHGHGHGAPQDRPKLLPDARAVIAVASGKGGVGKSATAVNLAVALARMGLNVGLLDADIYGPSLPRMLGVHHKPEVRGQIMLPIEAWGLRAMSIGFLVDEQAAMIWRGPMVMGALEQLMGQVEWGPLDVMIVDMPPGTGDAQLTMAQRVALTGAVIVSTPQDIALADARRGVAMFEKTGVPVLGLVENMSWFACPHCGEISHIFGHGGAKAEAEKLGVEFLAEIPLLPDIREASDAGAPVAAAAPESQAGQIYAALAARVWEKTLAGLRTTPKR